MSDTIRTFVAIELPPKIVASIDNIQESFRSYGFKVRWVRPSNIHLTLKFLGNVKAAETGAIGRALLSAVNGFEPLSITAKGVGVFPGIKRPRVLWVGVGGQINQLIQLQQSLDQTLADIGFAKEKRAFKGHLTMGRVKGNIDPRRLLEAIKAYAGYESEPFVVDKMILFKSDLQPKGAVYTKLMEAKL